MDVSEYISETGERMDVKGSLYASFFHPHLNLSAEELLRNHKIAQKFKTEENSVELSEDEYNILRTIFISIRGFDINDVELVRRVLEWHT